MTCFCDSDASAAAANDDSASVPRGRRTQPIAAAEILAAAVQRDVIMSWITSSYDVIMRWRSWWRHHMTAATCHEVYVKLIATWRVHLTVVMRQTFQGWRQSRTPYTVKVVVYQKWCKINPLLLHTTNRKCHMTYRFMPFTSDLEWPWRLQGLCNSMNSVQYFARFQLAQRVARSLDDSWAFLLYLLMYVGRLSRPRHCSKDAQPVLKAAYRSG